MKNGIFFFARLALGIGFLSAVADRLGIWGKPGESGVAWGNWENFVAYTASLNFNAPHQIATILGIVATAAEVILAIMLITAFKLKYAALASGVLLVIFGFMMAINTHVKYALDYSVFTAAAAAFLLYAKHQK